MDGTVRSVAIAFGIMRQMAEHGRELTLSEVSRMASISPSSCLAILRTLVNEGVLELRPRKRYAVAQSWAEIDGLLASPEARVLDRAQPMLERLARAQDATVGLWAIKPRERVELVRLGESNAATRIHMAVGQRQPIGAGSVGRALAAAQNASEDELKRRFTALRWQRPLSFGEYREQIAAAVARGYAVDDGIAFAGVSSIAAVVPNDPITMCISASSFAGSRNAAAMDLLGSALVMLAENIGKQSRLA